MIPATTFGAPQTMLSSAAGAGVDLADRQLVGIRMTFDRPDQADDDALERRRDRLVGFDLEARHRQPIGQFLRRSAADR